MVPQAQDLYPPVTEGAIGKKQESFRQNHRGSADNGVVDVDSEAIMRLGRILALVLTGAAVVASTAAFAHGGARGRVGVGVYVAPPPIYWGPPAPRYYYGPRPFYPGYGYGYGYGYAAPIYPGPVYGGAIYGPYPPAVWGTTAPPSAYVERTPLPEQQGAPAASADAAQSGYWHYCQNPEGYYPQVKECPAGWIRVLPQQQQPAGR